MQFENEQIDQMTIWGREFSIRIVADLFPGEEISEIMQATYTGVVEHREEIFKEAYSFFEDYCRKDANIETQDFNIFSYFIPKALYIKQSITGNRVAGLFCKYRYDRENDIVAYIENEHVTKVGTQDIIL